MVLIPVLADVFPVVFSVYPRITLPPFTWLPRLHSHPSHPQVPHCPPSVLTVGLGGDTRAVSYQQSHCASTGHSDSYAGGAHRACARWVRAGVGLVGVGAHVTLELRGRLTLHPAKLAEQHPAGTCPTKAPPCPTALFPLLAMVLLSMDTQVGEGGKTWKTQRLLKQRFLKSFVMWWLFCINCIYLLFFRLIIVIYCLLHCDFCYSS